MTPLTASFNPLPSVLPANTHIHTGTHTCFWKVGNPGFTQNARHWGFSQRETCMEPGYCSDVCVSRLWVFCTCDWIEVFKYGPKMYLRSIFHPGTQQRKAEYCLSVHSPLEGLSVGMFAIIIHLHCEGRVISFTAFIWIWSDSIDLYRSESIFCFCRLQNVSLRRLWQAMQFNLDRRRLFFVSIILINGSRILGTLLSHSFIHPLSSWPVSSSQTVAKQQCQTFYWLLLTKPQIFGVSKK